jgi:DNA-directed RNA polymerase subunit E'/Rpb7
MSLVSMKSSRMGGLGISGRGRGSGRGSGGGGGGGGGNMSLYIKNIITKKLSIPIKYVGANIKQVLEDILKKEFEGKCCIDGYVKKGSSKIITYSCGNIYGNVALFTIVFEYLVCNPPNGMRISCVVNNITNAGIMGVANNTDTSPVNIFIARDHHYNIPYFSQLKNEDVVMVRVIGQRFELNDSAVFIIAELEEQLERGGRDEELDLSKSKKTMENPKELSGAEGEGEGEREEEEEEEEEKGAGEEPETGSKAGPAKSPLSVIAEESQGMMKSLFSSKKSSEEEEEEQEQEQEQSSGSEKEQEEQEEQEEQ